MAALILGATGAKNRDSRQFIGGRLPGRRDVIHKFLMSQLLLLKDRRGFTRNEDILRVRKNRANRKRQPTRYFSQLQGVSSGNRGSTNMSINRTGFRRGRGGSSQGAISSMNKNTSGGTARGRSNVQRRDFRGGNGQGNNSRGNRGGMRGRGRGRQQPTSAAALDAQLDEYMGEDVRKARMDTELDAYFSRTGDDNKLNVDDPTTSSKS
eukprot:Gregarina_sp_Poly_1__7376@NODE_407_length_8828_cov_117_859034_g331_i0_p4_GENE_NODE_407_length_8828_cov_117_859034_g331_i0NODE_407_length_8828_cov_117_859034_g331_i0_p4_ORF_typecomplete_len209_score22_29FoP_duplication/PF13865_6/1_1e04FoP_duplication/PF13865_6/0_52FoP_duplication/PF13865_6/7_NODE_407_length_8828_cov_117_859034_g331_i074878113